MQSISENVLTKFLKSQCSSIISIHRLYREYFGGLCRCLRDSSASLYILKSALHSRKHSQKYFAFSKVLCILENIKTFSKVLYTLENILKSTLHSQKCSTSSKTFSKVLYILKSTLHSRKHSQKYSTFSKVLYIESSEFSKVLYTVYV